MRVNRSTLARLCLLTAIAVPAQPAASTTLLLKTPPAGSASTNASTLLLAQTLAQGSSPEFTLPASLDGSEPLLIDGSSSMRLMNEALTDQFQEQYDNAEVSIEENGSDLAVERLLAGEVDLAAIGRPLTPAEQDAGLNAIAIAREKIAIIVGPDNPFNGDITFEQFGQIFRGEITDWSELGGEPGPIRFVDRPESSDTRRAFQGYPVFQAAPFETGATADPVEVDETSAVIEALGSDGIGYAIANQVVGSDEVSIISMHKTLPDNPAYPFSQPRNYVYVTDPSDAVQGFLGIATGAEGQEIVEEVRDAEEAAAANIEGPKPVAISPDETLTATTTEENLAVIEDEQGNLIPLAGAGGAVTALAFSPNGETLATGTNRGNVRFWGVDGESKGNVFSVTGGTPEAVTDLEFEADDKLEATSTGRRGLWGLNGLPYGEEGANGTSAVVAGGSAEAGLPPWLWFIPLFALIGGGLWWLLSRGGSDDSPEAIRQTSPTATVPPPTTDPENDREVSNRAHSVISTDRVTDESRVVAEETAVPTSPTAESGALSTPSPSGEGTLPLHESTDLESPDLEGTNLDLMTPASAAAMAGGAVLGGEMVSGLDAGIEADSDDDEEWDDNLDLTLEDAPPGSTASNLSAETAASAEVVNTATSSPETTDVIAGADATGLGIAGLGAAGIAGLGMAARRQSPDEPVDESVNESVNEPVSESVSEQPEELIEQSIASEAASSEIASEGRMNEPATDIDSIEPTRDTVIAETETILDIEPTRETIISDNAVIFGEATASSADAELASPPEQALPTEGLGESTGETTLAEDFTATSDAADSVASDLPESSLPESSSPESIATGSQISATGFAAAGMAATGIAATRFTTGAAETTADPSNQSINNSPMEESNRLSLEELATVDEGLPELPEGYGESRIVLLPRDPKWAYAYWDVSNEHKEELRRQGGQRLMLRLYDVTDIDQNSQAPHSMQQQDCHEMARSWYLEIPVSDRDYTVELGYLTADDRWLLLTRSAPIRVPPIYPSDWVKDQFVTIDWNEDLAGQTFGSLGQPYSPEKAEEAAAVEDLPKIYDDIFALTQGQEALRVAGSLYGSMQPTAPGALSASGNVSGLPGLPGVPLTASGLNVSGLNMSGVGMLGDRKRNFWLVADAELIVYGATEPTATLTIGDRVVPLNPDGTFRFHMPFPDGQIDYPIRAVAEDGEQSRSIHMHFERETPERNTNTKAEAKDEWF